ncbi:hypothetical protein MKQ68_08630 [Chitinophaga horti]|uniref:Uncharacterized protein n=1 Tax=Chitinophaga horti TaxID=2920382 RepID=A0ABY6J725_9BACT|nr:hypothetical protein [Chitinophaga horti]UYQ95161.1 hypothetical protein MKQ68_08630 [Chitinophaga horti]
MSKYNKDTGEFISLEKGAKFTAAFRLEQHEMKRKTGRSIAAFFGTNKIEQILSNPKAVGMRIYYGLDVDGDGKADNKFVIVAVDAEGNDLIAKESHLQKGAVEQDLLDGGLYCPLDCAINNPLNSDI